MKQITSFRQVQELKVGSTVIQKDLETPVRFAVLSYTPIGWEDIEFELMRVEDSSGRMVKAATPGSINKLGSEFVSEPLWWLPL